MRSDAELDVLQVESVLKFNEGCFEWHDVKEGCFE